MVFAQWTEMLHKSDKTRFYSVFSSFMFSFVVVANFSSVVSPLLCELSCFALHFPTVMMQVCLFFRLSKTGVPLAPRYSSQSAGAAASKHSTAGRALSARASATGSGKGSLHAVLPTKSRLPFGFHAQVC